MSISPAQMILQAASAASPAPTRGSTQASIPAADRPAEIPADSPPPAPPESSPAPTSTDIRIDNQHQVYYAVVDDRSGDVLFEIPPQALRTIGESLNVPLIGESSGHGVDVIS